METKQCYMCQAVLPSVVMDVHRKVPGAVGGQYVPDNVVDLCNGCHISMHRISRKFLAGKGNVGNSEIERLFPDNGKARLKTKELIDIIVRAYTGTKDAQVKQGPKTVTLKVPPGLYLRAKNHVKSLRKAGGKITIETYLTGLLIDAIERKT